MSRIPRLDRFAYRLIGDDAPLKFTKTKPRMKSANTVAFISRLEQRIRETDPDATVSSEAISVPDQFSLIQMKTANQALQHNDHVCHGSCCARSAPAMIVADL